MKISVVISACDKREKLFDRALDTWDIQTMPKSDFELIMVDDANRENLRKLCQARAKNGLTIRFVRIDKSKSIIPVKSFIPVLTNNVGFKQARGEVIVVTGPETLQMSTNMDIAWTMNNRKECAYGLVFRADINSTEYISKNWKSLKNLPIQHILQIPGAQAECVTRPPHPPAYYYFMAVAKKYVEDIGGLDERLLGGICAEDDDFAGRMRMYGVTPVFEPRIVGIHQDHSREDFKDGKHLNRREGEGYNLWVANFTIWQENLKNGIIKVNSDIVWGNENLITLNELYQ